VSELASLFESDATLNSSVARALAAIDDAAARPALVRAMDHPERNVRIYAAGGVPAAGN
jgi:HEAT repeat protein